jgi:hypothetical protein
MEGWIWAVALLVLVVAVYGIAAFRQVQKDEARRQGEVPDPGQNRAADRSGEASESDGRE